MKQKGIHNFDLEQLEKLNVFILPDGYFTLLENEIKLKVSKQSLLARPNLFSVPEGYFKSLEAKIKGSILPAVSDNIQVHNVPEDYFNSLENQIYSKIRSDKKVIKVDFRSSEIVKYAIAASVSLLLIASAILYFLPINQSQYEVATKSEDLPVKSMIAMLNKTDITIYLENNENIETHDIMEFTSPLKQKAINKELEKIMLPVKIGEKEKQTLQMELDEIDISDLQPDI